MNADMPTSMTQRRKRQDELRKQHQKPAHRRISSVASGEESPEDVVNLAREYLGSLLEKVESTGVSSRAPSHDGSDINDSEVTSASLLMELRGMMRYMLHRIDAENVSVAHSFEKVNGDTQSRGEVNGISSDETSEVEDDDTDVQEEGQEDVNRVDEAEEEEEEEDDAAVEENGQVDPEEEEEEEGDIEAEDQDQDQEASETEGALQEVLDEDGEAGDDDQLDEDQGEESETEEKEAEESRPASEDDENEDSGILVSPSEAQDYSHDRDADTALPSIEQAEEQVAQDAHFDDDEADYSDSALCESCATLRSSQDLMSHADTDPTDTNDAEDTILEGDEPAVTEEKPKKKAKGNKKKKKKKKVILPPSPPESIAGEEHNVDEEVAAQGKEQFDNELNEEADGAPEVVEEPQQPDTEPQAEAKEEIRAPFQASLFKPQAIARTVKKKRKQSLPMNSEREASPILTTKLADPFPPHPDALPPAPTKTNPSTPSSSSKKARRTHIYTASIIEYADPLPNSDTSSPRKRTIIIRRRQESASILDLARKAYSALPSLSIPRYLNHEQSDSHHVAELSTKVEAKEEHNASEPPENTDSKTDLFTTILLALSATLERIAMVIRSAFETVRKSASQSLQLYRDEDAVKCLVWGLLLWRVGVIYDFI